MTMDEIIPIAELEYRARELYQTIELYTENRVVFELCGPKGTKKGWFLDVDLGLIQVEGVDGFMMVSDFDRLRAKNIWFQNMKIEKIGG